MSADTKTEFVCKHCGHYAWFEGVCVNADSQYCADWPPYTLTKCPQFAEKVEDQK